MATTEDGEKIGLSHKHHYIDFRRLLWKSDIHEQCDCAVWCLWEKEYDFRDNESEIPITHAELSQKLQEFAEMNQEERTSHRKHAADGFYHDDGVKYPCRLCGFFEDNE